MSLAMGKYFGIGLGTATVFQAAIFAATCYSSTRSTHRRAIFLLCGTALRLARAPSLTFLAALAVPTVESPKVCTGYIVGPAVALGRGAAHSHATVRVARLVLTASIPSAVVKDVLSNSGY